MGAITNNESVRNHRPRTAAEVTGSGGPKFNFIVQIFALDYSAVVS